MSPHGQPPRAARLTCTATAERLSPRTQVGHALGTGAHSLAKERAQEGRESLGRSRDTTGGVSSNCRGCGSVVDGDKCPHDNQHDAPRHESPRRRSLPVSGYPPQGDDADHNPNCFRHARYRYTSHDVISMAG
jgi:hypothetical protein